MIQVQLLQNATSLVVRNPTSAVAWIYNSEEISSIVVPTRLFFKGLHMQTFSRTFHKRRIQALEIFRNWVEEILQGFYSLLKKSMRYLLETIIG